MKMTTFGLSRQDSAGDMTVNGTSTYEGFTLLAIVMSCAWQKKTCSIL